MSFQTEGTSFFFVAFFLLRLFSADVFCRLHYQSFLQTASVSGFFTSFQAASGLSRTVPLSYTGKVSAR